jgi:UDP-N-acetylmuramoyl-tripeptide--D-alanyl-D-alanine ligase
MIYAKEELGRWTGGRWHGEPEGMNGFCHDTRRLRPGEVFVALTTPRRDGHAFLAQACEAGASAALVARPDPTVPLPQLQVDEVLPAFQAIARENRLRFAGPVTGITGSCGKTNTKDLLARLLGVGRTLATEANLNNTLGVPLMLTRLDGALHEAAVIEAGISLPGEMEQMARIIAPDIAIVTLVAPVHLEGMGSLEAIAREKCRLPEAVREGGRIFFPASCLAHEPFRAFGKRATVTVAAREKPPGGGQERTVRYMTETGESGGVRLILEPAPPAFSPLEPPPMAPGMLSNTVLAVLAALDLGVPAEVIQERLRHWRPSSWRGEIVRSSRHTFLADCYNASPPSMSEAFAAFDLHFPPGPPRLFLLGGMAELGPASARLHHLTGTRLKLAPADRAFLLGEDAEAFREGLLEAGARAEQVTVVRSLEAMRGALEAFSGPVLLKGSRQYALERLLPGSAAEGGEPGGRPW